MILQYDAPIKFKDLPDQHAFILYPDDTHVMRKDLPKEKDSSTNAMGVFSDDPWIHVDDEDMVYPIKRLRAADKNEDLKRRELQSRQAKEYQKFIAQKNAEAQEAIDNSLKIDREQLEVLKQISEKLDKIHESECDISNNTRMIYHMEKTLEVGFTKLLERLVEINGVLSKLLHVWTKK